MDFQLKQLATLHGVLADDIEIEDISEQCFPGVYPRDILQYLDNAAKLPNRRAVFDHLKLQYELLELHLGETKQIDSSVALSHNRHIKVSLSLHPVEYYLMRLRVNLKAEFVQYKIIV